MGTEAALRVRDEQPYDRERVRAVNEAAFGRHDEVDLIDEFMAQRGPSPASFVAEFDNQVVGHILFSPRWPV